MDASEALNDLLSKRVKPWARQNGLSKHGTNFLRWVGPNCKMISFVKSKGSTGFDLIFSLYAGVFYKMVHEFEAGETPLPKYPSPRWCQWWENLGMPVGGGPIRYWHLTGRERGEDIKTSDEIMLILETRAAALLPKYSGETDLAEIWGTDGPCRSNPYFGNGQRVRYLAIYLLNSHRFDELDKALIEVRSAYNQTEYGKHFAQQFIDRIMDKRRLLQ
jgi:hypothetical protein